MATTWRDLILDQLDFYWQAHLWPRIEDLSDEEYLWEPVAGCWSLREGDDGVVRVESISPEPPVAPITTIAWRMVHIGRDVLGKRARALFADAELPAGADMFDDALWPEPFPLSAAGGLDLLRQGYTLWRDGVASLDDDSLLRPLGPRGGPYAEDSVASLAMHLNRETMAHGAEICLLRDAYRATVEQGDPLVRAAYAGEDWNVENRVRRRGVSGIAKYQPSLLSDVAALHHWDVVSVLLEAGFPATGRSRTGATALHSAAAAGRRDIVDELLRRGADPTAIEPAFGLTAAGWADFFGHPEVAAALHEAENRG